jgi:hypothetical protein
MLLVFIKAFWLYEIILPSSGASLLASDLEMIWPKEWIRLIGLKSATLWALGFLGISVTSA